MRCAGTEVDNVEADEFAKRRLLCEEGLEVKIAILAINLAYLAVGSILSYKTRKIRTDQFSESSYVILILLCSGVHGTWPAAVASRSA
jgi:hypothetical protein